MYICTHSQCVYYVHMYNMFIIYIYIYIYIQTIRTLFIICIIVFWFTLWYNICTYMTMELYNSGQDTANCWIVPRKSGDAAATRPYHPWTFHGELSYFYAYYIYILFNIRECFARWMVHLVAGEKFMDLRIQTESYSLYVIQISTYTRHVHEWYWFFVRMEREDPHGVSSAIWLPCSSWL